MHLFMLFVHCVAVYCIIISQISTVGGQCTDAAGCLGKAAKGQCDTDTKWTAKNCVQSCENSCKCSAFKLAGVGPDGDCDCIVYINDGKLEAGTSWLATQCPTSTERRLKLACPDPPVFSLTTVSKTYLNKWLSIATYKCVDHAIMKAPGTFDGQRICTKDQTWLLMSGHNDPECILKTCTTDPGTVNQASWRVSKPKNTKGYDHGTIVTYTCNTGYEVKSGDTTRKCEVTASMKKWTDWNPPVCVLKDCGDTPFISYGGVVKNLTVTTYGEVANYSCNTGYELDRNVSLAKCIETGQWFPNISCLGLDCNEPPEIQFANLTNYNISTRHPMNVTYKCKDGYVMKSTKILFCNANGTWEGENPVCELEVQDEFGKILPYIIGGAVGGLVLIVILSVGIHFGCKKAKGKKTLVNKIKIKPITDDQMNGDIG